MLKRLKNIFQIKHTPRIKFIGFKYKNSQLLCQLKYIESIHVDEVNIELVISDSTILNNIIPTEVKLITERYNQYLQEQSLGNKLDNMYEVTADNTKLVLSAEQICGNRKYYSKLTHDNLLMIASKYYFDLGFKKGKETTKPKTSPATFKVIK